MRATIEGGTNISDFSETIENDNQYIVEKNYWSRFDINVYK